MLSSSSRSRPLNDSIQAFCQGEPGSMKTESTVLNHQDDRPASCSGVPGVPEPDQPERAGGSCRVICDNASTHKAPETQRWLKRHRRFTMHYTPTYSSGLNQVERWFSELTTKKLRRSTHRSVAELRREHRRLGRTLEPGSPSVPLAQDRRRDPRQPRLMSPTNQRLTTLGEVRIAPLLMVAPGLLQRPHPLPSASALPSFGCVITFTS